MTIPQTFGVRMIITEGNGEVIVHDMDLDEENNGLIRFDAYSEAIQSATVIVSSLTRYTSQPAKYVLSLNDKIH